MQKESIKCWTSEEFALEMSPEDFKWPYRDEVNKIYYKTQHPTEFLDDGRHRLQFLIRSENDKIDYYLTCETLSDPSGEMVTPGFPRQIIFDKSQIFFLIDKMRTYKGKGFLPESEKQKILEAFMKSVFVKVTGYGKRLDDVRKMIIVIE